MKITTFVMTTALLCGVSAPAAASSILTFNITGIANSQAINQAYGDRITGASDAVGSYGTDNGQYTPNVLVSYGAAGEAPNLWTAGYGDLTNIYFNDTDNDTTLTLTLLADAGFLVNLASFDLGSFVAAGQTIQSARVLNAATSGVLWSVGPTFVPHTSHISLAPNATANSLMLEINLTGLGSVSDDMGIDNVQFSQSAVTTAPVPEPATLTLLGIGLLVGAHRLNRARRA